jgi:hypothetical protein
MIPEKLKTGFGIPNDSAEIGALDAHFHKRLISITMALMKRATESAATFCSHSGRKVVTPEDIQRGLMYETMQFFKETESYEALEKDVNQMTEFLERYMCASDADEPFTASLVDDLLDEEAFEEEDDDDEEEEANDKKSHRCSCSLCSVLENVHDAWDQWRPHDPVEKALRQCLQRTLDEVPLVSSQ